MELMTSEEFLRQHMEDAGTLSVSRTQKKKGKTMKKDMDPYIECLVCKKDVKKSGMSKHMQIHNNSDDAFPCPECEGTYKTKGYLRRHISRVHRKESYKYKCDVCDKMFRFPSHLKQHSLVHTGEKPLVCNVCGKTFRAMFSLNSHMLIHTDEKPFACTFCAYKCRDISTLRKHENWHFGSVKKFECKLCNKMFTKKCLLKVHITLDHLKIEEARMTCDTCNKTYRDRYSLISHIKLIHNEQQKLECPLCTMVVEEHNYKAHIRTHSDLRPYKCTFSACDKTFKTKGDMTKHSIIHYPKSHFKCQKCHQTFSRRARYNIHVRSEHKEKSRREQCKICLVKFYTFNHLLKHMHMKHSLKRKVYKCDHCPFTSNIKPSLIGHIKSHENDQDRKCKICYTVFKEYIYLKQHYLKRHAFVYKPQRIKKERSSIKSELVDDIKTEVTDNTLMNELTDVIQPHGGDKDKENGINLTRSLSASEQLSVIEVVNSLRANSNNLRDVSFDHLVSSRVVDITAEDCAKRPSYFTIASERDVLRLLRQVKREKKDVKAGTTEQDQTNHSHYDRKLVKKEENKDEIKKIIIKKDTTNNSHYVIDNIDQDGVEGNSNESNSNESNNNNNNIEKTLRCSIKTGNIIENCLENVKITSCSTIQEVDIHKSNVYSEKTVTHNNLCSKTNLENKNHTLKYLSSEEIKRETRHNNTKLIKNNNIKGTLKNNYDKSERLNSNSKLCNNYLYCKDIENQLKNEALSRKVYVLLEIHPFLNRIASKLYKKIY